MSGPTTPNGFGEFPEGTTPGEGTGQNETNSQTDWMLGPLQSSLGYPRVAWRLRWTGFDHGMEIQDVLDSIGGYQLNSPDGGIRQYAIATGHEPYRLVTFAGSGINSNAYQADAAMMFRAHRIDLNEPIDNVQPFNDDENIAAIYNNYTICALVKGNGDLVLRGTIKPNGIGGQSKEWTPIPQGFVGAPVVSDAVFERLGDIMFVRCKISGAAAIAGESHIGGLPLPAPVESGGGWNNTQTGKDGGTLYASGSNLWFTKGWTDNHPHVINCAYFL